MKRKLVIFLLSMSFFITIMVILSLTDARAPSGFWVEGDNHMHTTYSDGDSTPNVLKEVALGVTTCGGHGLDFMVITDHSGCTTNDFPAWDECLAMTTSNFIAVDGCEVTSSNGHVNCIPKSTDTFDHSGSFNINTNWDQIFNEIHTRGGWAIVNHPCNPTGMRYDFSSDDYDALEVWNGSLGVDQFDFAGINKWLDDLGRGKKTVAVGGSDCHQAHTIPPGEGGEAALGYPHNSLWVDSFTWPSIIDAYAKGRLVIHDYNNFIDLKAYHEDGSYGGMISETVWVKVNENVKFTLNGYIRNTDISNPSYVRLYSMEPNQTNSQKIVSFSQLASGNFSFNDVDQINKNRVYYADIYRTFQGVFNYNYALTNALWIQVDGKAPSISSVSKTGNTVYWTATEGADQVWLVNQNDGSGLAFDKAKCYYTTNLGANWISISGTKVEQYSVRSAKFKASIPTNATAYYVEAQDNVGNISRFYSDATPPVGSVSINQGENYTNQTAVTLSISGSDNESGLDIMIISNNSNFSGSNWESYSQSKAWTLTSGAGVKTIYIKFKDRAGNISSPYADSIELLTVKSISPIFGQSRYETSAAISQEGWVSSEYVVLARGDLFPDALAGAALAGKHNSPILLTESQKLTISTAEEIKRLKASKAILLGAEAALSAQVASDLNTQCQIKEENIKRIGGKDRYETDALIGNELGSPDNKTAIIATGENYPDALASASFSGFKRIPVLLVNKDSVPDKIKDVLKNLKITKTVIVGGNLVVGKEVEDWLNSNGYSPNRIFGDDRYGTAKALAEYGILQGMKPLVVYIATGENFPDALSIGPLAASNKSPIILTGSNILRPQSKEWLNENKNNIFLINIAGGSAAVSDSVKEEIAKIFSL